MIGIRNIGVYVPPGRVLNLSRLQEFDMDETFVRERIGFVSLARKEPIQETSDMAVLAYQNLQEREKFDLNTIEAVVVCTQNPDGFGLPHASALVHRNLKLSKNVACFDISLACSGFVYGLNIATAFMKENGFKNMLFFTADPYSKILNSKDRSTELLFGDAATCTLLSDAPRYINQKTIFGTAGEQHEAAWVQQNRMLTMKGGEVLRCVSTDVPPQIEELLRKTGIAASEVPYFIFHQGSKYIVDLLRTKLGLKPEQAPFLAGEIGNTVSSTVPIILAELLDSKAKYIVISAFGAGMSWASGLLVKTENK